MTSPRIVKTGIRTETELWLPCEFLLVEKTRQRNPHCFASLKLLHPMGTKISLSLTPKPERDFFLDSSLVFQKQLAQKRKDAERGSSKLAQNASGVSSDL